jgi:hypothetical protein
MQMRPYDWERGELVLETWCAGLTTLVLELLMMDDTRG